MRWIVIVFSTLLFWSGFVLPVQAVSPSADGRQDAHVLVLHSYHPSFIWTREMETGIMTTLQDAPLPVHISVEYLDQKNFPEVDIQKTILHSISEKYRDKPIDVVIATDNYAVEQAIRLRDSLFPQAAILFCGYNGYQEGMFDSYGRVGGIVERLDSSATIDLAKKMFPQMNRVVVLHDTTESGLGSQSEIKKMEQAWWGNVQFEYWSDRSYAEILRDVQHLPPGTVLLFGILTRDRLGNVIEMREFAENVSAVANVPLFQLYKMNYGTGSLGGVLIDGVAQGRKTAEQALQLLNGEIDSPRVVVTTAAEKHLDFRQLERFHIALSRVPEDVVVDYKPESFYEEHQTLVWTTLGVIFSLLGVIYILTLNIHRRKQAEAVIRQMNDELEQRVTERTRDLAVANQELEAFSYSVSHDLRAPLRSIDGFSQILVEDYEAALDETGKDYLGRIRAASEKMAVLIDDILRLSRVSRSEIDKQTIDLSALAKGVVDELLEAQPGRKVVFDLMPGLSCVADRQLLRIALVNLFGNALKYSEPREETRLQFEAVTRDNKQVYCIRDNGVGFDMTYADKLFGAFQRLHSSRDFAGSGIGLAIVERIIRKHGGLIWAESAPEAGAAFFFTLQP